LSDHSSQELVLTPTACVVALVDRFARHRHIVDIDADSWCQKHALGTTAQEPESQKRATRAR